MRIPPFRSWQWMKRKIGPAAENRAARTISAQDIEEAAAYYASQEIVKATD